MIAFCADSLGCFLIWGFIVSIPISSSSHHYNSDFLIPFGYTDSTIPLGTDIVFALKSVKIKDFTD